MSQSSSKTRTWTIVSVVGSALALIGFFVPWFFATGSPPGGFDISGLQLTLSVLTAPFQPYFTFSQFYLLFAFMMLLLVAGLVTPLLASVFDLSGRPVAWLSRIRAFVIWIALIALLVGVGLIELLFQALASFDTPNPNATALIPGVGIWLMVVGFVETLVGIRRARSAPRQPRSPEGQAGLPARWLGGSERSKAVSLVMACLLVGVALALLLGQVLPGYLVNIRLPVSTAPVHTGNITEFPLAGRASGPNGITVGPDGNLWFTEFDGDRIGRLTPAGVFTEFALPTDHHAPQGITVGPDGNLWFVEANSPGEIGQITPSGVVSEFASPSLGGPAAITAGPDGNLWFTRHSTGQIGRITPAGSMTEFQVPTLKCGPEGITVGPDGNLWFTEDIGNRIGRIPPTGSVSEFLLPTPQSGPSGIVLGPDGNLWFTEAAANQIGRITPTGEITEFPLHTAASGPTGITLGPDGNLWFTEAQGGQLGRITPTGTVTEFPLPQRTSDPEGITTGPDGSLWFTEMKGNAIGRFVLDA